MTKFYQASNANRLIAGITFEITDIVASTAWGVYQTDDPALIQQLDALSQDPRSAVTAISQADYEAEIAAKKKLQDFRTLNVSSSPPKPEAQVLKSLPAGRVAQVTEDHEPLEEEKPIEITQALSSVDEALSTAPIQLEAPTSDPAPTPSEKPKRKAK